VGVQTTAGLVASRVVVLAAGLGTRELCAPLGFALPVAPSPALLLRFAAPRGLVRTLVDSPEVEVREAADGRLLVAAGHRGEAGRDDLRRRAHEVLERLTATFGCRGRVEPAAVRLGLRPMPADGLPIVGPLPGIEGVHVAVMHAGVTLAPVVGRLVAAEVVTGAVAQELRGLRPGRVAPAGGHEGSGPGGG
jgi:glycine/D-amino acid oxidase-like deaminating enzyme